MFHLVTNSRHHLPSLVSLHEQSVLAASEAKEKGPATARECRDATVGRESGNEDAFSKEQNKNKLKRDVTDMK